MGTQRHALCARVARAPHGQAAVSTPYAWGSRVYEQLSITFISSSVGRTESIQGGIVAENIGPLALYCESTMKAGTYENRAVLKCRYENRALLNALIQLVRVPTVPCYFGPW